MALVFRDEFTRRKMNFLSTCEMVVEKQVFALAFPASATVLTEAMFVSPRG